jgi:hypothetical protein
MCVSTDPRARPGETRADVARLLAQGLSQAEIARQLAISRPTVCFHVRNLGVEPNSALVRRHDWPRIRKFHDAGHSAAECRREFGFSVTAWTNAVQRGEILPRPRLEPLDRVLAAGRRRSRVHVKARLRMAGLKEDICEACGLTDWRGGSLALELHHLNGDGEDNRLENLQLLCPNCHRQTQSWGGRKNRRVSDQR